MESNTQIKRPDWLTDNRIAEMRQEIKDCDNPYTDAELDDLYDAVLDMKRLRAHHAIKTLTKYNLL